eukprot:7390203-Pyramimonas_sp.AAC.1
MGSLVPCVGVVLRLLVSRVGLEQNARPWTLRIVEFSGSPEGKHPHSWRLGPPLSQHVLSRDVTNLVLRSAWLLQPVANSWPWTGVYVGPGL